MDYKAIINLMKEMNQTELTKIEIEDDGFRICLEKGSTNDCAVLSQPNMIQPNNLPFTYQIPNTAQAMQTIPVTASEKVSENKPEESTGKKIVSPMVGTYYSQSSPDKPAFVKVGDKVKKGQTLCIIEAMKLMNEIECEYDGEIVKILVNNEDMVEYGQPLFEIA